MRDEEKDRFQLAEEKRVLKMKKQRGLLLCAVSAMMAAGGTYMTLFPAHFSGVPRFVGPCILLGALPFLCCALLCFSRLLLWRDKLMLCRRVLDLLGAGLFLFGAGCFIAQSGSHDTADTIERKVAAFRDLLLAFCLLLGCGGMVCKYLRDRQIARGEAPNGRLQLVLMISTIPMIFCIAYINVLSLWFFCVPMLCLFLSAMTLKMNPECHE